MAEMNSAAADLSREKASEIQHWARRYAQNRALGVIVVLFLALGVAGGLASFVSMMRSAWRQQDWTAFVASLAMLAISLGLMLWITLPRLGGEDVRRMGEQMYGGQFRLLSDPSPEWRYRYRMLFVVFVFFACVQGTAALASTIPVDRLQPVSALYVIPFLILIGRFNPNGMAVVHYLWPALYGVHALLILAGAPIVFFGQWAALNILLPVGAYGVLTVLVGHFYSRYALKRLREAAR